MTTPAVVLPAAWQRTLNRIGHERGTPAYVYFAQHILDRCRALKAAFGDRFEISYAVKANPNGALLSLLYEHVAGLDVSSAGELDRGLAAGYAAGRLSFSGPAKRPFELERAVVAGCGEVVCESEAELEQLNAIAGRSGRTMDVLLRINPSRVPPRFGISMGGKPSQFGIDEEQLPRVLARIPGWTHLNLCGFHIYSGTNCLDEDAIAENFTIFIELFRRFCAEAGLAPRKLVFGSGFGVPYFQNERPLDLGKLADLIRPQVDGLRSLAPFRQTRLVLEMGRWLVALSGFLLTGVVAEKSSRGVDIRLCDAGFNNHLGACGMMGSVIRRNWMFWNTEDRPAGEAHKYLLAGPLCTTIDVLATQIELPRVGAGDVLAIGSSGAYGITASPVGFISHPVPREYLVRDAAGTEIEDISGPLMVPA